MKRLRRLGLYAEAWVLGVVMLISLISLAASFVP